MLNLGDKEIAIYLGNSEVGSVYLGADLVWPEYQLPTAFEIDGVPMILSGGSVLHVSLMITNGYGSATLEFYKGATTTPSNTYSIKLPVSGQDYQVPGWGFYTDFRVRLVLENGEYLELTAYAVIG